MACSPKKRARREAARLARLAAREASGLKPPGAPFCACGQPNIPHRPTCGDPACKQTRRRTLDAARKKFKLAAWSDAGLCIKCGKEREDRISEKTGRKSTRCKRCRIRLGAGMRKYRKRNTATAKTAAILRLAAAAIERKRVQQARLEAGLPYSFAANPVLPKSVERAKFEL